MQQTQIQTILDNAANYAGLATADAAEAQRVYGPNSRPIKKRAAWPVQLWNIFTEPMMLLILATVVVYFFLGDTVEGFIMLGSIIPIGLIEFFQEKRTNDAISVLDKMMVEYCQVMRDEKVITLPAREVVPGDLIYLAAGDKIAADGFLLRSPGLLVDESVLTGEAMPVTKFAYATNGNTEENGNGNNSARVSQGTLVTQGEGFMLAVDTGGNTAYGKLGNLLEKIVKQDTPLQSKIHKLVRRVALVAVFCAGLIGLILYFGRGWVSGLLGGITIAMSLIPEEFPIVFSVFLIMGVWRMARQKALVREMVMVETLGSATVICSDKTGTLTEGRMALEKVYYRGKLYERGAIGRGGEFGELFRSAMLAFEQVAIDPIEIEVQKFAAEYGYAADTFYKDYELIADSSFSSATKMVHHIWRDRNNGCFQYTAGAPEIVIQNSTLGAGERKQAMAAYEEMATAGYRVVAVARKDAACSEKVEPRGLEFVGLLTMSDPPRAGVKEAIGLCQKAGIRIVMITGDNRLTAHNIAERVGLIHNEAVISGPEIALLSPAALQTAVKRHDIFARILPEQKYLIVKALQANGEVVAMTGDGVNDAPALRQADIGIAMGESGTDVARAAAGIVLLDNNFSTIVNAVREGRRIYDNLRHAFSFLFAFHLPIVGLAFVPLLFNQNMIFLPIHIIFLELICDPASVLGFEKETARRGLMEEPPRPVGEPLIKAGLWQKILLEGFSIFAVSFGFYAIYGIWMNDFETGHTLAFGSLVAAQIFLILMVREWQQVKTNRLLLIISGVTLAALAGIMLTPRLLAVFHFHALVWTELALMFCVPFIVMGVVSFFLKRSPGPFVRPS